MGAVKLLGRWLEMAEGVKDEMVEAAALATVEMMPVEASLSCGVGVDVLG